MQKDAHAQLIRALTHGAVYAHPTTEITVLQTHISWVVLTGPYAYKIKKPANLGFVDFSTLAKRHFFCQEELRLNRRLAPHLYLEVVAISGTPEHPRVDGEGAPIEYAVKMRQFSQDQLLSHLLPEGKVQGAHIDHLAQEVSAFHARIATADPKSRFGTYDLPIPRDPATALPCDTHSGRRMTGASMKGTHDTCTAYCSTTRQNAATREGRICRGKRHAPRPGET